MLRLRLQTFLQLSIRFYSVVTAGCDDALVHAFNARDGSLLCDNIFMQHAEQNPYDDNNIYNNEFNRTEANNNIIFGFEVCNGWSVVLGLRQLWAYPITKDNAIIAMDRGERQLLYSGLAEPIDDAHVFSCDPSINSKLLGPADLVPCVFLFFLLHI